MYTYIYSLLSLSLLSLSLSLSRGTSRASSSGIEPTVGTSAMASFTNTKP